MNSLKGRGMASQSEEMPTDIRTGGEFWAEKRDGRWQLQMRHRGPGSSFCVAQINHWADNSEALTTRIANACNAYEPTREALTELLNVPELADIDPEDRSEECWEAERKARAALSTLPVNDRHHSGSDNERLRKALSKIEVWADDRSHLNNVFETIAIEARAALNSTGRQTSDDVGILRKATETLVECLLDVRLIARLDDALEAVPPLDAVCLAKLLRARDAARAALKGVPAPFSGDLFEAHRLADKLLTMAARRSIETQFGWTHPDCVNLQEAARILKNEPQRPQPEYVGAVLSDAPASEAGKLSR